MELVRPVDISGVSFTDANMHYPNTVITATVDENGTVTAIAEGEAIITAESADGVTAECKVTVEKKESFGKKLLNVITAPFIAIINLFKKLLGK